MKDKVLANGILVEVITNNKERFQFLVPPESINFMKKTINEEKVMLPVIFLTQNYQPIKPPNIPDWVKLTPPNKLIKEKTTCGRNEAR